MTLDVRDGLIKIRIPLGSRYCEDCDLGNNLTVTGRPRYHHWYGFKLTNGCESCGGSGLTSRTYTLHASVALTRLTPKQRFVIERRLGLTDGHRYKQREIADAMGVAQQTVSDLESRGRERLVAMVAKHKTR